LSDLCEALFKERTLGQEEYAEVGQFLVREGQRLFDLSRDMMLRATPLRLDYQEHVLLLVMHHIAADGWSLDVLFRELWSLYKALRSGELIALPELPVQYADYAVWQRQRLQDETLRRQTEYWKKQLANALAVLDVLPDNSCPPAQTSGSAMEELPMPGTLLQELRVLCRQHNVTLFMVLLAAWATLLHRYSGQDDLLITTPFANRNRVEIEGLIGCFAEIRVLRHNLARDPSFTEFLGWVRETLVDAFSHGEVPIEELAEELRLRPKSLRVGFALRNISRSCLNVDGLQVERIKTGHQTSPFLCLIMVQEGDILTAKLAYNPDLFKASSAIRMLGHLRTLLKNVVTDPEQRVSELSPSTRVERLRRAARRAQRSLRPTKQLALRRIRTTVLRTLSLLRLAAGHVCRPISRRPG
jgi:hypothetical protein